MDKVFTLYGGTRFKEAFTGVQGGLTPERTVMVNIGGCIGSSTRS